MALRNINPLIFVLPSIAFGYSGLISFHYRSKVPNNEGFDVGSIEDVVMDGLSTGDIILFRRRWYHYHIPANLLIAGEKYLFGSTYNHGGIIIEDKNGKPYLLENTFSGKKLRPYDTRMLSSNAAQIVLIPILPRQDLSTEERKRNFDIASDYVHSTGDGEGTGIFHRIMHKIMKKSIIKPCPSVKLIQDMSFKLLNERLCFDVESCDDLVKQAKGQGQCITKSKKELGDPIVLFTNR